MPWPPTGEPFATVAAHDLQEPLRAVLTFTSLLERRHAHQFDADALGYLRRVSAAAHRIGGRGSTSTGRSPRTTTLPSSATRSRRRARARVDRTKNPNAYRAGNAGVEVENP